MGKFSEVLLASDFDRTLTDREGHIPEANLKAIRHFISEGGRFTVASGRSIPLFRSRAAAIPINAPCILFNGAACYDYREEKLYYVHPMTELAMQIVYAVRRFDAAMYVELQGQTQHYAFGTHALRERFLAHEHVLAIHGVELPPKPWIKVSVFSASACSASGGSDEETARFDALYRYLKDFCADRCYLTFSMPYILEMGNPNCSKGSAARALAGHCGRRLLACVGDAPNDTSMLREADFAFTPADHDPALRAEGLRVVAPCADGSLADTIAQLEELL